MEEFDKYARDYESLHSENIRLSGFGPSYFDESKVREVYSFLKHLGREKARLNFLNFGCGIGKSEKFIRKYLPNSVIYSIDVSRESIDAAMDRNKGLNDAVFVVFDGDRVPFEINFDVIFAANVFHHIAFEKHQPILRDICDKLDDNGVLFLFEHNPLNPVTLRVVRTCDFDKGARLLNPLYTGRILSETGFGWGKLRFTIFFPNFLSLFIPLEKYLKWVPFGAQYYYIAAKHRR
jgi:SAM-dependent methyltransferase